MDEEYLKKMCSWLRTTKGITKIDIFELAHYVPEYEEHLKENEKKWDAANVKCDLCGHEWTAVYYSDCEKLECPKCRNMAYFNCID